MHSLGLKLPAVHTNTHNIELTRSGDPICIMIAS